MIRTTLKSPIVSGNVLKKNGKDEMRCALENSGEKKKRLKKFAKKRSMLCSEGTSRARQGSVS